MNSVFRHKTGRIGFFLPLLFAAFAVAGLTGCTGDGGRITGRHLLFTGRINHRLHLRKTDRSAPAAGIADDLFHRLSAMVPFGPVAGVPVPQNRFLRQILWLISSKTGGCLVRPDPWHVVPVGKRLVNHLEETENLRVYRDSPDDYPYIFAQPYPGWTRAWIQIATEKKPGMPGRTVALEPRNYLVDYEAGRFLLTQPSDTPGGGWSLSPDGQKIVYFNRSIFPDEKPVSMPDHSK